MPSGTLAFVGREKELALLGDALAAARDGRGGLWLLSGEPGIGKSRLAEEIAARAGREGFRVLWGQCWEAGGAPVFWPWIQVLRALRRSDLHLKPTATRAPYVVQLLPELREVLPDIPEPPPLGAEQARFQLLDAISGWLGDVAVSTPLLVVFEDLHAADSASLLLLDFLARQARGLPLLLLGTFRESDAQRYPSGELLLRVAADARSLALGRLVRSDVVRLLELALGEPPPDSVVDSLFGTTEGNALFLVELARILVANGLPTAEHEAPIVPSTVRTAIRERLRNLSEDVRETLAQASVMGRELRAEILSAAFARDPLVLRAELEEAERAEILLPIGDRTYRFSHLLVREVLYQDLPAPRRADLHRVVAETLAGETHDRRWSEIAYHFLAAGPPGREGAVEALAAAGAQAVEQLAFEEAIRSYSAALAAYDDMPSPDPARRVELLLGLGHAQLRSGDLSTGRDTCARAAELARDLGAVSLLAEAALEYGSVLVFAQVDPRLVSLLEGARDALGGEESSLLARVLARLAAARQPAPDPRPHIALANEAIAMARRVGDPRTLLATLRSGCSAMMDLVEPADRLELNREHVRIARHLRERAEAYRGCTRLAFDYFELGRRADADEAIASVARIAKDLGHPHYRWRAVAFQATVDLWEGRFDDAEAAIAEAQELGTLGGDPNAPFAGAYQRARLFRLMGRTGELEEAARGLGPLFSEAPGGDVVAEVTAAGYLFYAGRRDEARRTIAGVEQLTMALTDRTFVETLSDLAFVFGDAELAGQLYARMASSSQRFVSGGVLGMTWDGPLARPLALAALATGRHGDARRYFEDAIAGARDMRGVPMVAWISVDYAEMLAGGGAEADAPLARSLAAEAAELAARLGMAGIQSRAERCLAALAPTTDRPATSSGTDAGMEAVAGIHAFQLVAEGDVWRVECDGSTFRLKDSKGLGFLSQLLEEPGREIHVLDLAGAGLADGHRGDAGELLDSRARAEYKQRVAELREEIAEAEDLNDSGRVDRARAELEMIGAELARAVGLGGRARRAGGAAERARVNVTRRLRSAIRQIQTQHPALGRYLSWTVRTGTYCSYQPS